MDSETAKTKPGGKLSSESCLCLCAWPSASGGISAPLHSPVVAASCWPGLAELYMQYTELELEGAGKKRGGGGTPDLARGLKRLIKEADNEQRSGGDRGPRDQEGRSPPHRTAHPSLQSPSCPSRCVSEKRFLDPHLSALASLLTQAGATSFTVAPPA